MNKCQMKPEMPYELALKPFKESGKESFVAESERKVAVGASLVTPDFGF